MLDPGTTLGPYTIADLLGIGGMGEVYRAHDDRLNRQVAIKVLPSHLADDRASLERFRRETRAVAALSHPNILAIFDVGTEGGLFYAVTELLEGETLRSRLVHERVSPREALEVMLQIADGVAAAHARTIVHRDLKPENVFLTTSGRVKVLDFGLARGASATVDARLASGDTEVLPTQPGVVMGTVGYLAPEQLEAKPPTPASDVFALGCILFEMLSGYLPFDRPSSAHAMAAVLRDPAPRLQLTGDAMLRNADAIVQRCLAKDPAERFADAGELADAIRGVLAGEKIRVKSAFPWRLVAVAAIGLVIATVAYVTLSARNRLIDHGYDLRASDIRGDRVTRRLVALAMRADAQGNRPKAQELLEEASRRGRSAFPAALLSSFNDAAGNDVLAKKWEKEALSRLGGAPPYESLLVRYLVISGDRARDLALARSVLELRPEAWRLRLAAAHILLQNRENDAALSELRRIDVEKPDDRRLMLVLSDRASLGDVDGAARDLRRSRLVHRPALLHYTEGRIAWSRGNTKVAQQMWLRAAEEAATENIPQLEVEARELAGVAAIRLGEWADAQRLLARASHRAKELNLTWRQWQTLALAAYAAYRTGDFEERDRKLRAASSIFVSDFAAQGVLRLLAIRIESPLWKSLPAPSVESEPALAALIRAREAWAAGNRAAATRELRRATGEGVETTHMREDAELLAAEMGLPYTKLKPDPPYPNLIRYVAIFDLERVTSESSPAPASSGTRP